MVREADEDKRWCRSVLRRRQIGVGRRSRNVASVCAPLAGAKFCMTLQKPVREEEKEKDKEKEKEEEEEEEEEAAAAAAAAVMLSEARLQRLPHPLSALYLTYRNSVVIRYYLCCGCSRFVAFAFAGQRALSRNSIESKRTDAWFNNSKLKGLARANPP